MKRIRRFTRRAEFELVDSLQGQLRQCRNGVALATQAVEGEVKRAKARRRIAKIEHRGDEDRAKLVRGLVKVLVSPIDREDLFRLSRAIDDVLDGTRDFIREHAMYKTGAMPEAVEILEAIDEGLDKLKQAVDAMISAPRTIRVAALEAKKTGVRSHCQRALAEVLDEPLTNATLKRVELLRRLDEIGLSLASASDTLADGAMKRSH